MQRSSQPTWTERFSYRHVGFAAGVHGLRHRVHQVAADAEVAHLHLALSVDQHVGRFHICGDRDGRSWSAAEGAVAEVEASRGGVTSMDDLQVAVQVLQSFDDL